MTAAVYAGITWNGVERGLACGLLAILGLWAAGLLLSFALNYSQIASVAEKPATWWPTLRF